MKKDIILAEDNNAREIYIVRKVRRKDLKRCITNNRAFLRDIRIWDYVQIFCRTSVIHAFAKKQDAIYDCRAANNDKENINVYFYTAIVFYLQHNV